MHYLTTKRNALFQQNMIFSLGFSKPDKFHFFYSENTELKYAPVHTENENNIYIPSSDLLNNPSCLF